MSRFVRTGAVVVLALLAAACGDGGDDSPAESTAPDQAEEIDYAEIGLWDDGPCDESRAPLAVVRGVTAIE